MEVEEGVLPDTGVSFYPELSVTSSHSSLIVCVWLIKDKNVSNRGKLRQAEVLGI